MLKSAPSIKRIIRALRDHAVLAVLLKQAAKQLKDSPIYGAQYERIAQHLQDDIQQMVEAYLSHAAATRINTLSAVAQHIKNDPKHYDLWRRIEAWHDGR